MRASRRETPPPKFPTTRGGGMEVAGPRGTCPRVGTSRRRARCCGMMTERDIRRTARRLLDRHGAEAAEIAARCAEALDAAGDGDGRDTWLKVAAKIRELRAAIIPFAIC